MYICNPSIGNFPPKIPIFRETKDDYDVIQHIHIIHQWKLEIKSFPFIYDMHMFGDRRESCSDSTMYGTFDSPSLRTIFYWYLLYHFLPDATNFSTNGFT